jgi:hypothetical protein
MNKFKFQGLFNPLRTYLKVFVDNKEYDTSLEDFSKSLIPILPSSGGNLEGANYLFVKGESIDTDNANELQDVYNKAKTMSPSIGNRITIVVGPGKYSFDTSPFQIDTNYIDIVSLDGNRSIIFNGTGSVSITANDVFIQGINVLTKSFSVASNLNLLRLKNCQGGNESFGSSNSHVLSGTFEDCQAGNRSFGGATSSTVSGKFTNCVAGNDSFGWRSQASGTFINCIGGQDCFGGSSNGNSSGNFINCSGLIGSFSPFGSASGYYENCKSGDVSFGGFSGTASGVFVNCSAGDLSFGGTASGTFTDCTSKTISFGAVSASGNFNYCLGGDKSFGGDTSSTLTGKLYYCRIKTGGYKTPTGTGKIILSIDGSDDIINLTA